MTRRHILLITLALLVAGTALAAFAEPHGDRGPRGFGHRGPGGPGGLLPTPEFLELSDEQIEAVEALRAETRATVGALRAETHTLRQTLRDTLDGGDADPAQVGQIAIDLHALKGQMRTEIEAAREQFEALLTDEQLEKLEAWREARQGRRERMRERFRDRTERWDAGPDGD